MAKTPARPRVLRGATFNILRGRTPRQMPAFIKWLGSYLVAHKLDFMLLQEINGAHAQLEKIPGYDLIVFPSAPDKGDNGVLVRHGVKHGPGRSVSIEDYWFTKAGKKFPARSIVTVGLNGWLRLVTVHAPVQVLNHSSKFAGPIRRIKAYRSTASRLVRIVKGNKLKAIVVAGDWNATTGATGYGTPNWVAKTAGLRKYPGGRIDWSMAKGATVSSSSIVVDHKSHGSDHPVVRFNVTETVVKPAAAPKAPTGAAKIIEAAKHEVGYHEGRAKNGSWNNQQRYSPAVPTLKWSQGQPWCATFMSWLAQVSGFAALYPCTASCDVAGKWFKDRHQWQTTPVVGAQVFFGTPRDLQHTGLVIAYDATTITTIEGNTNTNGSPQGDGVYQLHHRRRDEWVQGYGVPKFKVS